MRTVNNVTKAIGDAFGSTRQTPAVRVINSKKFIAVYDHGLGEILISEFFYDMCTGFGADSLNAIAVVLGHELAHYFEKHDYTGGFNEMTGAAPRDPEISKERKKYLESEADIIGLKYAFFAGFDSYKVVTRVLHAIYMNYPPGKGAGYPSKEERVAIARKQVNKLLPFIDVFNNAAFLQLAGFFDEAKALYDYLLFHDFTTPEVLNNIGSIYLNQALSTLDDPNNPEVFAYPVEVDPGERLNTLLKSRDIQKNKYELVEILDKAAGMYRSAITRDEDYVQAYLNLATVHLVQDQTVQALFQLKKIQARFPGHSNSLPPNYYLLKGIALAKEQRFEEAQPFFLQAKSMKAFKANYNSRAFDYLQESLAESFFDYLKLRILLLTTDMVQPSKKPSYPVFLTEIAKGPYSVPRMKKVNYEQKVIQSGKKPFVISHATLIHENAEYVKLEFHSSITLISSPLKVENTTLSVDLSFNSTSDLLLRNMGPPSRELVFSNGFRYFIYFDDDNTNQGILFTLKQQRITNWQIFARLKP
jgi:hypothetical protein